MPWLYTATNESTNQFEADRRHSYNYDCGHSHISSRDCHDGTGDSPGMLTARLAARRIDFSDRSVCRSKSGP